MKAWIALAAAALAAGPALAQDAKPAPKGKFDYGFAGLMARDNRADLPDLLLSSGKPVHEGAIELKCRRSRR